MQFTRTYLEEWQEEAEETNLHPNLPVWMAEAVRTLHYHCADVGPSVSNVADEEEVTPAVLANLIAPRHETMVDEALKLACNCWRNKLNETIIRPLKEELKQVKAELKQIRQRIGEGAPSPQVRELRIEEAELKERQKELQSQIEDKEHTAGRLAGVVREWICPEAATWQEWLASQPMYDEVSTVDGRRSPPTTVLEFIAQEIAYVPDINDGVRVNIAPLQRARLLTTEVLAKKDVDKAIEDRAEWRADERRWVRQGKLHRPGWWPPEIQT